MNTLIVVTNLGHLKAWRLKRDLADTAASPSFETIADRAFQVLHSRFSSSDTDQAGRFPDRSGAENAASSGMSIGERHNEIEEVRHGELIRLAEAIGDITERDPDLPIYFAAPQPIHGKLLELLPKDTRGRICRDLPLDLVKESKLDLLKHFGASVKTKTRSVSS